MDTCAHEHFEAKVTVNRLEDTGGFAADVTVTCIDCQMPFRFLGLPAGLDVAGATTSVDGTEARLAICPRDARLLNHHPDVRGFQLIARYR
jgi:hypothetical protein